MRKGPPDLRVDASDGHPGEGRGGRKDDGPGSLSPSLLLLPWPVGRRQARRHAGTCVVFFLVVAVDLRRHESCHPGLLLVDFWITAGLSEETDWTGWLRMGNGSKQAGRQAGKQASRQAGRQACMRQGRPWPRPWPAAAAAEAQSLRKVEWWMAADGWMARW
jgi:hypothetical protein